MKLIITEDQFNRLPLITEDIQDNPVLGVFNSVFITNKEKLNQLYLTIMSYTVHDILYDIKRVNSDNDLAEAYHKEVNDMATDIERRIENMSEESYYQNEVVLEDIRNEVESKNGIIYMKQSAIERLYYGLTHLEESIRESEGKYEIYIKDAFSDIKTIEV